MEGLLEAVQTKRISKVPLTKPVSSIVGSHKDALEVLKNSPDLNALVSVMDYLKNAKDINIKMPSSSSTPILQVLVEGVLPDYWSQITSDSSLKSLLHTIVSCLTSLPAISAIVARLKAVKNSISFPSKSEPAMFLQSQAIVFIQLMERILSSNKTVNIIWEDICKSDATKIQKTLYWKETLLVLGSGKVIALVAELESILNKNSTETHRYWLSDAVEYSKWLARNLALLAAAVTNRSEALNACSQLFIKGFSIGYSEKFLGEIIKSIVHDQNNGIEILVLLLKNLKTFEQRTVFISLIRVLNINHPDINLIPSNQSKAPKFIAELASFFSTLLNAIPSIVDFLVEALTSSETFGLSVTQILRRGIFAAIHNFDEERAQDVLDRVFETFADEMYIKHAPIVQQEINTHTLLLVAGHTHRKAPLILKGHARSSQYMNGVSKYLNSKSTRIHWLGMIVGSSVSALVDTDETRMSFGDLLDNDESKKYLNLTAIEDQPAVSFDIKEIFHFEEQQNLIRLPQHLKSKPKPPQKGSKVQTEVQKQPKIMELGDEDADLIQYSKPDSDPEDEEEDPTLIDRDKPRAPVYIRDLIAGLQDSDNYDRHKIALQTAAPLIRRKTGFGKEVSDHSVELATILINLNDKFEMDNFHEMRHAALLAIILADTSVVPDIVISYLFESDLSYQQRTAILTALGLSARELAGHKDDDKIDQSKQRFPTNILPDHLHKIYADTPPELTRVSSRLQHTILQPLAQSAADTATGPNALKVRTFSTRIAVQKARKPPTPNTLAQLVANHFLHPLISRWWIARAAPHSPFRSAHVLPTYLRTLGVVLHAAGPFALSLPLMTAETWHLCLQVARTGCLADRAYGVVEALLFVLLALLDVNAEHGERVAREHARLVVETVEWARAVMAAFAAGDEEADRIRAAAAGVLVRCQEVVEKWHRLMVGDMMDG